MDWFPDDWAVMLLGVVLVVAFSAAIGFERELKNRPAGLRTHILVGIATWLLVTTGELLAQHYAVAEGDYRPDPLRILEAIIAGISFIGAGTIFVSGQGNRVRGLTTAAALLCNVAVATAFALDLFFIALLAAAIVLVTLVLLSRVEDRLQARAADAPQDAERLASEDPDVRAERTDDAA